MARFTVELQVAVELDDELTGFGMNDRLEFDPPTHLYEWPDEVLEALLWQARQVVTQHGSRHDPTETLSDLAEITTAIYDEDGKEFGW